MTPVLTSFDEHKKENNMKNPVAPATQVSLGGYAAKQCAELLRKNLDPTYSVEDQDPLTAHTQAIMAAGNEFESEVVRVALMAAIANHVVIDTTAKIGPKRMSALLEEARKATLVVFDGDRSESSLVNRENLTHALCEQPGKVRVLWNPRLRKWRKDGNGRVVWSDRSAEPDVMYRPNPRVAKSARWGAIDVKHHNPFEGSKKGLMWDLSALSAPFPMNSTAKAFEGILKREDAMQLAHYHRALEFHSLAGEAIGGIIGKELEGELQIVWLNLNEKMYERGTVSALSLYDEKFAGVLEVAKREIARREDPTLPVLASPEWKAECNECIWRSTCHDELSARDHITLLPGITPARAEAHYLAGVTTVQALAALDIATAKVIDAGVENLAELISEASLVPANTPAADLVSKGKGATKKLRALEAAGMQTAGDLVALDAKTASYPTNVFRLVESIDQARAVDFARMRRTTNVFRKRGIEELEIPRARVEIHVDMENDNHIYMWGVRTVWKYANGKINVTHEPSSLESSLVTYEATDEAEAKVFASYWKYLSDMIAKANAKHGEGNVRVFHYTAAEDRCMRSLAEKHAGVEGVPTIDEVEAFLASDIWVDLYPVLTNQLIWPTENLTLKSLAKYVQFEWRDDDPSGSNSVVWYQKAIDESDDESIAMRQRIIDYNADDCAATARLLSWLQQYDGKQMRKLTPIEDLDRRYARAAKPVRTPAVAGR